MIRHITYHVPVREDRSGCILGGLEKGGFIYGGLTYSQLPMTVDEDFTFICPECEESLTVNDSMMDALIDKGCVICGSTVSTESFVPTA